MKEIDNLRRGAGEGIVELLAVVSHFDGAAYGVVCVFEYYQNDLFGLICGGVRFRNDLCIRYVFCEIVKAVAHLHERNIFHRDLKSALKSGEHSARQELPGPRRRPRRVRENIRF